MSRTIRVFLSFCILFVTASAFMPGNGMAATIASGPAQANARSAAPNTTVTIYSDNLSAGWSNWSYSASVTIQDPAYHHGGSYSASCALTAWGALFFGNSGLSTAGLDNLVFWVNGGTASGQNLAVNLVDAAGNFLADQPLNNYVSGGITANTWKQATVPLADLQGTNTTITGV